MPANRDKPVVGAFARAWQLKWRLLVSHVALSLLAVAIISPVTALILRTAIGLSGNPALADQDIAYFLLSPVGLICLLVGTSILITAGVLDTSFLMSIHVADRLHGLGSFRSGLASVLPRLHTVFLLAAQLTLRLLVFAAPFLGVSLIIAKSMLTEFDINYYLAEHPPEFIRAVCLIGAVIAFMLVVLVNRMLGWVFTLPLVLFAGVSPRRAFAQSEALSKGHRWRLLRLFATWGLMSFAMGFILVGSMGIFTKVLVPSSANSLSTLVALLTVVVLLWATLNALITTLTSGAFAILVAEEFDTAGGQVDANYLARTDALPGLVRRLAVLGPLAGVLILVGGLSGKFLLDGIRLNDEVIVIAHRGAAGERPENTMSSINRAIEVGADFVEIDVQETSEGEVIVVHDSDFMKLAGVPTKVWDVTAAELKTIDIGSWFDPLYSAERTPLLRDVLQAAKDKSKVLIELKYYGHNDQLEQRVLDIVAAEGMQEQVAYMSLKMPLVEKTKELDSGAQAGLLAATAVGDLTALDADFLAVNTGLATRSLVQRADAVEKPVYVWTVNDALVMSQMLSRGIKGLITDEPALALKVLEERKELSIPERLLIAASDILNIRLSNKVYRDVSP
ncbi:MAG: glycerophosphodiester phosphodiesterase family protein [Pseudoruegeria sp.]